MIYLNHLAAILAAYGTAIGKALQEYYNEYPEANNIWDTWEGYDDWVIAAPVICMVCAIALTIILPFSYFTVVNGSNKYSISSANVAEE